MIAVNYTSFRNNMKTCMDQVADNIEPMLVTRKNNNIVILTESAYNNLLENAHLMSNKANYDRLMHSKAQLDAGKVKTHHLIEVDNCE